MWMYMEEQPYVLQKVADLIASFWALFLFTDNKSYWTMFLIDYSSDGYFTKNATSGFE